MNHPFTGLITGRDATFRFGGGLLNLGGIGLSSGTNDLFGDINNTGTLTIGGGAHVTFHDDLTQNGTMVVSKVGNTNSVAVSLGAFGGTGGFTGGGDFFMLGDLAVGASAASVLMGGNLFLGPTTTILVEIGGTAMGQFDQLVVTGDMALDGNLTVSLIDGFTLRPDQTFKIIDHSGVVMGTFLGLDEGDVAGSFAGRDLFITYQGSVRLFTIPEPATLSVLALLVVLAAAPQSRRSRG